MSNSKCFKQGHLTNIRVVWYIMNRAEIRHGSLTTQAIREEVRDYGSQERA